MRDVLQTLERWAADGTPVAIATVVDTERSAPRMPGAVLAVSDGGEVVGSVTGGPPSTGRRAMFSRAERPG